MDNRFEVTVGAGTMMSGSAAAVRFPHRWTPGGVTVEGDFTCPRSITPSSVSSLIMTAGYSSSKDGL
jgi:hypothetical protein